MEEKTTIAIMSSVISTVPLIDLPNQYRRNTSTNVRNTMSMKTPMPAALSHLERLSAGSSAAVALSRKPVPWVCVLSILRFLVGEESRLRNIHRGGKLAGRSRRNAPSPRGRVTSCRRCRWSGTGSTAWRSAFPVRGTSLRWPCRGARPWSRCRSIPA